MAASTMSFFIFAVFATLAPSCASDDEKGHQNKLANANNDFAFDLYRKICESASGSNVFLSPISIVIGLGMLHAGAASQTLSQLTKAMHLEDYDKDDTTAIYRDLKRLLDTVNKPANYKLSTANRLFAQTGYELKQDFRKLTEDYFRASLEALDFRQNPSGSTKIINDWVAEQTENKIKDLLPEDSITEATVLVLANAIYFKGVWITQFNKDLTERKPFHVSTTKETTIDMMTMGIEELSYFNSTKLRCQILELPYVGGQISMFIFLPHEIEGLASVETRLTAESFDLAIGSLGKRKIQVSMPKFVLDQGVALKQFLMELGIVDAFSRTKADLSRISGSKELVVTEAMHKAYVSVDEEGTEAAGAIGIITVVKSAVERHLTFNVDRQFLFSIVEKTTGSILFLGRVVIPPEPGAGNIGVFGGRTGEQRCCDGNGSTMLRRCSSSSLLTTLTAALILLEFLHRSF